MAVDTEDLERELCRIPEVYAARIVTNGSGRPTEARILASPRRPPKRVRRDVQSVAMATFGVDLDPTMITVTQLDQSAGSPSSDVEAEDVPGSLGEAASGEEEPRAPRDAGKAAEAALHGPEASADEPEPAQRAMERSRTPARDAGDAVALDRVGYSIEGHRLTVEVSLSRGGSTGVGRTSGPMTKASGARLAARATLHALTQVFDGLAGSDVDDAAFVSLAGNPVAVVAVALDASVRSGSAVVSAAGEHHAMARAVIAAVQAGSPA